MGMQAEKRLYTEGEAAIYLGRTVWGVRELRYKGLLPYVKTGRSIRYDIRDLERFVESNKIVETIF